MFNFGIELPSRAAELHPAAPNQLATSHLFNFQYFILDWNSRPPRDYNPAL